MMTTDIVLIFGSGHENARVTGLPGERSLLQQLVEDSHGTARVAILSYGPTAAPVGVVEHVVLDTDAAAPADRLWRALGAFALRDRLSRAPIGRLLNSMGPVDQGRVFWRSVKRSPAALSLLKRSNIAIAADLPAVKTAWKARRKDWVEQAHYDHRSASLGVSFTLPTS